MTNMIEVSADVGFKNVAHLLGHDLLAQCAQRVMRATPRPISIASVAEIRFKNRLENARHRLLKQSVRDSGNTQRPRTALPRPLGDVYPPNRWNTLDAGLNPFADYPNSMFQLTLQLLDALAIHSAHPTQAA